MLMGLIGVYYSCTRKQRNFDEVSINYALLEISINMLLADTKISKMEIFVTHKMEFSTLIHHFVGYRFVQFQHTAWQRAAQRVDQMTERICEL